MWTRSRCRSRKGRCERFRVRALPVDGLGTAESRLDVGSESCLLCFLLCCAFAFRNSWILTLKRHLSLLAIAADRYSSKNRSALLFVQIRCRRASNWSEIRIAMLCILSNYSLSCALRPVHVHTVRPVFKNTPPGEYPAYKHGLTGPPNLETWFESHPL